MRTLFFLALIVGSLGCQSESLDIRAPYRIRLNTVSPGTTLRVHQRYVLPLELLTDSYYSAYGYQLVFYQQTGLGRLQRNQEGIDTSRVFQKVPVVLPLGRSVWQFTPEAVGSCEVVLIAQQERGYTQPDTVRMNFQIIP